MADEEHLKVLRQGVDAWNAWRRQARRMPDLSGASLPGACLAFADLEDVDLEHADLTGADLRGANLIHAWLTEAALEGADVGHSNLAGGRLRGANLADAKLTATVLRFANLAHADLTDADLTGAFFHGADLTGADLTDALIQETVFADLDLSRTKGLETCVHWAPSIIDHRTLQRSGQLPLSFLRGCGLPDNLIEYLPSLLNQAIQFYSCFISYSSKDDEFAQRLHADLQGKGIRCWFAPEDMKIGDRVRSRIDEVIRLHEKLLLVLSANSINSDWVEKEVETAFEKERETQSTVLFPVRLDDTVMESKTGWAADIKRTRHIGDFRRWKGHGDYRKAFERLLRDLRIEPGT
jgi:uncharacterized protein YjbI with pentapeptide repeats